MYEPGLFHFTQRITISPLEPAEARLSLLEPVRSGGSHSKNFFQFKLKVKNSGLQPVGAGSSMLQQAPTISQLEPVGAAGAYQSLLGPARSGKNFFQSENLIKRLTTKVERSLLWGHRGQHRCSYKSGTKAKLTLVFFNQLKADTSSFILRMKLLILVL